MAELCCKQLNYRYPSISEIIVYSPTKDIVYRWLSLGVINLMIISFIIYTNMQWYIHLLTVVLWMYVSGCLSVCMSVISSACFCLLFEFRFLCLRHAMQCNCFFSSKQKKKNLMHFIIAADALKLLPLLLQLLLQVEILKTINLKFEHLCSISKIKIDIKNTTTKKK